MEDAHMWHYNNYFFRNEDGAEMHMKDFTKAFPVISVLIQVLCGVVPCVLEEGTKCMSCSRDWNRNWELGQFYASSSC